MIPALAHPRLIVVTGKGGVGKSVVAAALGVLGARQGKRTLVVELSGQTVMSSYLGGPKGGYEPTRRGENLYTMSITMAEGMEEYLTREMHSKRLYQLVFQNDYVGPFINAVPALEDLINTGKIMDLDRELGEDGRRRWDLVVVDGPPTGQGINLLKAPQAIMDMTRVGPMYKNARLIHDLLTDPARTAVCIVTLPEEMPVNETLEMHAALSQLGMPLGPLFVNEVRRLVFNEDEDQALRSLAASAGELKANLAARAALSALLDATRSLHRRVKLEREQVARLKARAPQPLKFLPKLLTRHLGPQDVQDLADLLDEEEV